jgi:hypothetical protein
MPLEPGCLLFPGGELAREDDLEGPPAEGQARDFRFRFLRSAAAPGRI